MRLVEDPEERDLDGGASEGVLEEGRHFLGGVKVGPAAEGREDEGVRLTSKAEATIARTSVLMAWRSWGLRYTTSSGTWGAGEGASGGNREGAARMAWKRKAASRKG